MRKFVSEWGKHVKRERKVSLLMSEMDIFRLLIYAQQVEEDKKKDREHLSKKAKSTGHEPEQRQGKGNMSSFQKMSSGCAPPLASAPA